MENSVLSNEKKESSENTPDISTLDELEATLNDRLTDELAGLEFLKEEKDKIGNPDELGDVVKNVVWEQFINQIGVTAGEDFIRENNGLTLDLRTEAHIQTTENFANGKVATHNTKIDYQKRYDDWQSNFQKDPNKFKNGELYKYDEKQKVWTKKDNRTDTYKKVLTKEARKPFDKGRPKGNNAAGTNADHTIPAAEMIRDPAVNAFMSKEEQVQFANSDTNIYIMDSAANQSKGDSTTTEFLNSDRNGKKPEERFDIDPEEMREKDKIAREELAKKVKEGEKKAIETGKQSQREEAFRIGGKALRAVIMGLLAGLVKEIVSKLIKWFKSVKKDLETLLDSLKEAISTFIGNLKQHIINAANTLFTTIATAIIGPVFGTIKKVWMLLKQGWQSLKNAIDYIKAPENKGKPIGRLLLETGKIVIAGLTGTGAILLGEVVEKGLMTIPIMAVDIPLIGSLASILGIFLGAVTAGIIGAIALNMIEKRIAGNLKDENTCNQISKRNDIMNIQRNLQVVTEIKTAQKMRDTESSIKRRHEAAANIMRESIEIERKANESSQASLDELDELFK